MLPMIRRVMVEDPELPYPESVAASHIHKAGQLGSQAAKYLFYNMGFAAVVFLSGAYGVFAITEKGLALYKEVFAVSRTRQRGLESLLTAEERKVFEKAFQRIIDFYIVEERAGGDAMFGADGSPRRKKR